MLVRRPAARYYALLSLLFSKLKPKTCQRLQAKAYCPIANPTRKHYNETRTWNFLPFQDCSAVLRIILNPSTLISPETLTTSQLGARHAATRCRRCSSSRRFVGASTSRIRLRSGQEIQEILGESRVFGTQVQDRAGWSAWSFRDLRLALLDGFGGIPHMPTCVGISRRLYSSARVRSSAACRRVNSFACHEEGVPTRNTARPLYSELRPAFLDCHSGLGFGKPTWDALCRGKENMASCTNSAALWMVGSLAPSTSYVLLRTPVRERVVAQGLPINAGSFGSGCDSQNSGCNEG